MYRNINTVNRFHHGIACPTITEMLLSFSITTIASAESLWELHNIVHPPAQSVRPMSKKHEVTSLQVNVLDQQLKEVFVVDGEWNHWPPD